MSRNYLRDKYPELWKEIHPEMNVPPVVPESFNVQDITVKSERQIWWKCQVGHEWIAAPRSRSSSTGSKVYPCPGCREHRIRTEETFMTIPILQQEFAPDLNPGIDPYMITKGSDRVITWRCSSHTGCDGHVWETRAKDRATKGCNCPFCSHHRTCSCDSIMTNPRLAPEFDPTLNPGVDPTKISQGSNRYMTWRCSKSQCGHHIWTTRVCNRTNVSNMNDCPFCSGRQGCPCNSFMNNLLLATEFSSELNPGIDPWTLLPGSDVRIIWKCSSNKSCSCHTWQARIAERKYHGCPFCVGQKTCDHSSFMNDPLLSSEFDYSLNPGIDPWKIGTGSGIEVTWKCSYTDCDHHIWKTTVNSRSSKKTSCVYCVGLDACPCSTFLSVPLLKAEFVRLTNPSRHPSRLAKGSNHYALWKCSVETCRHEWEAQIASRARGGESGCPRCAQIQTQSRGAIGCQTFLEYNKIKFEMEARLPVLPRRRFDFLFEYNNRQFLLEFDGEQHFQESNKWRSTDTLEARQIADRLKTVGALVSGYTIIRISSRKESDIANFLLQTLSLPCSTPLLAVDNFSKYSYLFHPISDDAYKRNSPQHEWLIAAQVQLSAYPIISLSNNQLCSCNHLFSATATATATPSTATPSTATPSTATPSRFMVVPPASHIPSKRFLIV